MVEGQGAAVPFPDNRPQVAEAVAMADTLCRERGAPLTALRRAVLEALHHAGRPMRAYDLIPRLAVALERTLTPQTVTSRGVVGKVPL